MKMVDDVNVSKFCGCRFIGNVDWVFEWEIPDWKGFELGVSRTFPLCVIVIELTKAGG